MRLITVINLGILIGNILILWISIKLYTEYLKERSARDRWEFKKEVKDDL